MLKSFNFTDLKTMAQVTEAIAKERDQNIENSRKYWEREFEENLKRADLLRQALAKLDACGVDLEADWVTNTRLDINLGKFSRRLSDRRRLAETMRAIREALECPVEEDSKSLDDSNVGLVRVKVRPRDYPMVHIEYVTKLPKKAKCRIVTQRIKTLVCSTD